jgi:rhodanese-related sulfurtransferase
LRVADFLVFVSAQWLLVSLFLALVYLFVVLEHFKAGKQLSVHDVTRLLNGGEALLVDIRDAKEYQSGHINQAINIPLAQLDARMAELESARDRRVILVDKLGQQAAGAGRTLRRAGFKVQRLRGGMAEWRGQSLPVVS